MSLGGQPAGGVPGTSPRIAVQSVQRIQQRIIVLNTQYSHVLGQFNMALQRLQTHVGTARPHQAGGAWDLKTTQLAAAVDRLALETESLTDKLDDLVDLLSDAREALSAALAGPAAPAGADNTATVSSHAQGGARA